MRRVLRPGGAAAATVWAHGGMPSWRLFWDAIVALEPAAADMGPPRTKRPMTGEGELRAAFEGAGFADVADCVLTIRMDYADFDDFWYPMVYGQGPSVAFSTGCPKQGATSFGTRCKRLTLATTATGLGALRPLPGRSEALLDAFAV